MSIRKLISAILGASLLSAWFLSILLWSYISINIVRFDTVTYWRLGLVIFVLSFTCLAMFLTFWWRNGYQKALPLRFLRATLLTTSLYSLMLVGYLAARVIINRAPLSAPFIDTLLPWFTFFRLGAVATLIGLFSLLFYLIIFRKRTKDSRNMRLE